MDDTDFRLLQAMGFQPYTTDIPPADSVRPARLARRVGLGVKAVKERIARMEADGVIAGYSAFPNLAHFPLSWTSFHFRVPEDRKQEFLKAIEPLDGVVGTYQFLGRDVCVDLFFRDAAERDRRVRVLSGLAGVAPWEFYDNAKPAIGRALSNLDWRIVRALRNDAKQPLPAVARILRVTPRTVKSRFDRMVHEGSLWVVPAIDLSKIPGFVPFALLVYVRPDARGGAKVVLHAVEPDLVHGWVPPSPQLGSFVFFLRARTTAGVEAAVARVRALAAVERVEMLVPTGYTRSLGWLDEAIDRRIAETGGISESGPPTTQKGTPTARACANASQQTRQSPKR